MIDLILKKSNQKTSRKGRIRGRERLEEVETGPYAVEEKPAKLLNRDISSKEMDKAFKEAERTSEEAGRAFKEAGKGGGRRKGGGGGRNTLLFQLEIQKVGVVCFGERRVCFGFVCCKHTHFKVIV